MPGMQGSGVGSELIRASLAIAGALGEEMIFVLGEPDYYAASASRRRRPRRSLRLMRDPI